MYTISENNLQSFYSAEKTSTTILGRGYFVRSKLFIKMAQIGPECFFIIKWRSIKVTMHSGCQTTKEMACYKQSIGMNQLEIFNKSFLMTLLTLSTVVKVVLQND